MFNCNDDVLSFHDLKATLPQAERNAMRERRDANRDRLKTRLKATSKPLPAEFIKQGSYAMRTMVQDKDNDYDIDDGVYFTEASLRDSNGRDMEARSAREMVCAALQDSRFKRAPQVRESCVRIYYDEGYHVDMPVYRIRESDGEYELATGNSWVVSRAADVEAWYERENERLSPDAENGRQLRRVTRMVKKFARSRGTWKPQISPGFTITKLVVEHYSANSRREDQAVRDTMQAIHDRLQYNLEVTHPVTPGCKLTKGANDTETAFLRDKLEDALKSLKCLDDPKCTGEIAADAWDAVFNTRFFSDRRRTKTAALAPVYGTAPTIISNPPRPWSK